METAFCDQCFSFQLKNQPSREQMFNENYAFFQELQIDGRSF